jgi:hypothetical protein
MSWLLLTSAVRLSPCSHPPRRVSFSLPTRWRPSTPILAGSISGRERKEALEGASGGEATVLCDQLAHAEQVHGAQGVNLLTP